VDFNEIWDAGDAIEDEIAAIFYNLVASGIPEWRTFKLLTWVKGNPLINFEPLGRFS
jgi:hypothetical protein